MNVSPISPINTILKIGTEVSHFAIISPEEPSLDLRKVEICQVMIQSLSTMLKELDPGLSRPRQRESMRTKEKGCASL